VPELGSHGSVRGARGNSRPYRENDRRTVKVARLSRHDSLPVAATQLLMWCRLKPQAAQLVRESCEIVQQNQSTLPSPFLVRGRLQTISYERLRRDGFQDVEGLGK
jgi:hypothetical protein